MEIAITYNNIKINVDITLCKRYYTLIRYKKMVVIQNYCFVSSK
ncbi:MAG: hypothetical protein K0Q73_2110 [Paenibacillus sp.]|nr:hypothetical protein [Paenibacillus sp.]